MTLDIQKKLGLSWFVISPCVTCTTSAIAFIYLFIYNIRRHARQIQYWANNKLKDCLKKKHQNQKQEKKKKITHKKYKNMPNKQKQQNKIAGKRQKQNWLKKVGVDGQFEGLERSGLNNGFGQVIPKGGNVWVKGRLWKRQTAKRGVNSTGIKVTQTGTGMGSVGVGRWAQAMEDFEQVTKSGNVTTLNKSW